MSAVDIELRWIFSQLRKEESEYFYIDFTLCAIIGYCVIYRQKILYHIDSMLCITALKDLGETSVIKL